MSADKRSVSTDALATLGTIITDGGRDAIHLAVEPVIAGENLKVGEDIGVEKDGTASAREGITKVGIVDPFLKKAVKKGEMFWLIVYPRQITSLRHVWEHPNFPTTSIPKESKEDVELEFSKKWMTKWAIRHMSDDYYGHEEHLSDESAYANAINAGKNNSVGCYEDAADHIDNEWWDHWEKITGLKGKRDGYFSCSC
jgi:hypothetical protein